MLTGLISRERAERERVERFTVWQAMTDGRVWAMCMIALGLVIGTTGAAIWMPQLIKQFGLTTMQVGFVAAIPSFVAVFATLFAGWNADRTGARIAHIVVPFLCAVCGFVLAALTASPLWGVVGLTVGTAGIAAASPSIWTTTRRRSPCRRSAAGGMTSAPNAILMPGI